MEKQISYFEVFLTTQSYFDEAVTDAVYAGEPFTQNGQRATYNDADNICDDHFLLNLREDGEGYIGIITLRVAAG